MTLYTKLVQDIKYRLHYGLQLNNHEGQQGSRNHKECICNIYVLQIGVHPSTLVGCLPMHLFPLNKYIRATSQTLSFTRYSFFILYIL